MHWTNCMLKSLATRRRAGSIRRKENHRTAVFALRVSWKEISSSVCHASIDSTRTAWIRGFEPVGTARTAVRALSFLLTETTHNSDCLPLTDLHCRSGWFLGSFLIFLFWWRRVSFLVNCRCTLEKLDSVWILTRGYIDPFGMSRKLSCNITCQVSERDWWTKILWVSTSVCGPVKVSVLSMFSTVRKELNGFSISNPFTTFRLPNAFDPQITRSRPYWLEERLSIQMIQETLPSKSAFLQCAPLTCSLISEVQHRLDFSRWSAPAKKNSGLQNKIKEEKGFNYIHLNCQVNVSTVP